MKWQSKRARKPAASNLKPSVEGLAHNSEEQVEERIRQLSGLNKKGTDTKIKSQREGGCVLTYTSNNTSIGQMSIFVWK